MTYKCHQILRNPLFNITEKLKIVEEREFTYYFIIQCLCSLHESLNKIKQVKGCIYSMIKISMCNPFHFWFANSFHSRFRNRSSQTYKVVSFELTVQIQIKYTSSNFFSLFSPFLHKILVFGNYSVKSTSILQTYFFAYKVQTYFQATLQQLIYPSISDAADRNEDST
ncbi:unnamed protein product [Paramecium octaurelia]|uniref:Uncharacterized protein n=1 Tax=Paramecium octaurelia TaxID=43137 RepID=A0A8S1THR4_PAROT|nr:unnamed protein product [Paramecium octaurelia]